MIKKPDDDDDAPYRDDDGPSVEPLPEFSENVQAGHVAVDFSYPSAALTLQASPEDQAPPPFTPYEAEYFEDKSKNIISHDPHLNEDGEALYRFLLTHSTQFPQIQVRTKGWHMERRTRLVTTTNNQGRTITKTEHYNEHVTDFDFCIDLSQNIVGGPYHFSVGDAQPTYRGRMVKEIDTNIDGFYSRIQAPKETIKIYKAWQALKYNWGLSPWMGPRKGWVPNSMAVLSKLEHLSPDEVNTLKSSKTLREWADDYCASRKYLKEFSYEKIPYGWDIEALNKAISEVIRATHFHGETKITFPVLGSHIFIRPSNHLSRILSNKWLTFLLWILLIYPFIWLFKRFHSRGGGRWQVSGAGYPFKRWERIVDMQEDENGDLYCQRMRDRGILIKPDHIELIAGRYTKLVGVREGDWFKKWEGTIRESILNRVQKADPIFFPTEARIRLAGSMLDGYDED